MVKVTFSEEEVNYMVLVLNQFLKSQPDAITASKDVVFMVEKFKNAEKVEGSVKGEPRLETVESVD